MPMNQDKAQHIEAELAQFVFAIRHRMVQMIELVKVTLREICHLSPLVDDTNVTLSGPQFALSGQRLLIVRNRWHQ